MTHVMMYNVQLWIVDLNYMGPPKQAAQETRPVGGEDKAADTEAGLGSRIHLKPIQDAAYIQTI